jgi:hypothetical protein
VRQQVQHALQAGESVDLRCGTAEHDDPALGAEWGPERTVRSDHLYELLVRPAETPPVVVLCGARISGGLNLEAVRLARPVILEGCFSEAPINLNKAQAPAIRLTGCQLCCLAADQLETRGDLDLSRSTTTVVSLRGARVGGDLILDATTLTGGSWPLDLAGATLIPTSHSASWEDRYDHMALVAGGLRVDGDMCSA